MKSKVIKIEGNDPEIREKLHEYAKWVLREEGLFFTEKYFDEQTGELEEIPEEELYKKAKKLVLEVGKCSTSMLQRHLHIGYMRTARLVDRLEEEGIVGPQRGSCARKVLKKTG